MCLKYDLFNNFSENDKRKKSLKDKNSYNLILDLMLIFIIECFSEYQFDSFA